MASDKLTDPRNIRFTETNLSKINLLIDELKKDGIDAEKSFVVNSILELGFDVLKVSRKFRRLL